MGLQHETQPRLFLDAGLGQSMDRHDPTIFRDAGTGIDRGGPRHGASSLTLGSTASSSSSSILKSGATAEGIVVARGDILGGFMDMNGGV